MEIKEVYKNIINVDPVRLYSADLDSVILDQLRQTKVGNCQGNALILDIIRIISRSMAKIINSSPDGSAIITVTYEALVIKHKPGNILLCTISKIDRHHNILCTYKEHTLVNIRGNANMKGMSPGQMIPVLVSRISTTIGGKKITVNAHPFAYTNRFCIYELLPASDTPLLDDKKEEMDLLEQRFQELPAKIRDYFCDLFYPYKETAPLPSHTYETLVANVGKWALRHPKIPKESNRIMLLNELPSPDGLFNPHTYAFSVIKLSVTEAGIELMDDRCKFLRLIIELCEAFNTDTKLMQQKNIWEIYKHVKE